MIRLRNPNKEKKQKFQFPILNTRIFSTRKKLYGVNGNILIVPRKNEKIPYMFSCECREMPVIIDKNKIEYTGHEDKEGLTAYCKKCNKVLGKIS